MNQVALARRSGLSVQYVNDLWLGRSAGRLSLETIQKLKKALGVGYKFFYPDESVAADDPAAYAEVQ
jgi:transcriptional regulator with XRE-family HTH domain